MAFVQDIVLHNFQTELNGGDITITVPFGYSPREWDRTLYFHSNFRFIRVSFRDSDGRGDSWTINGSVFYERYEPQPVTSDLSYTRTFENSSAIDTIGYTPSTTTNSINGYAGYGWGFGTEAMSLYFFPDSTGTTEQSMPQNPVTAYTDEAATDPADLVWISLTGSSSGIDAPQAEIVPNDVSFPAFELESRMLINVREPDLSPPRIETLAISFPASRVLTITAGYNEAPTTATITDAVVVSGATRTPITFGAATITDETAVFTSTALAAGLSGGIELKLTATDAIGNTGTYTATADTIGGTLEFTLDDPDTDAERPEDTRDYWWDAPAGVLYEGCNITTEPQFPNGRPYVWRVAHEVIAFVTSEYVRRGTGNSATYHRIDYINPFHTLRLYYQTIDGAGELTEPIVSVLRTYSDEPVTKESTVTQSQAGFLLGRGRFLADNEDAERSLAEAAGSGGGGFGRQFEGSVVGRGSDTLGLTPDAPEESAPTDNTPTDNTPTGTQDTTTQDAADSVAFGGFGGGSFSEVGFSGGRNDTTPQGGETNTGGVKTTRSESAVQAEQNVSDILGGISISNDLSSFAPAGGGFVNDGAVGAVQSEQAVDITQRVGDIVSRTDIAGVDTTSETTSGVESEQTLSDLVGLKGEVSIADLEASIDAYNQEINEVDSDDIANQVLGGAVAGGLAAIAAGLSTAGVLAAGIGASGTIASHYGLEAIDELLDEQSTIGYTEADIRGLAIAQNRQQAAQRRNQAYRDQYGDRADGIADRNGGGFNPGGGGGRDNDPSTPF